VLEKVKPGTLKGSSSNAACYLFTGTDVITYNDKIAVQHPLLTNFSLFVDAKDTYKIISKVSAEEIKLSESKGKLNIKCKNLNTNLAAVHNDEVLDRMTIVQKSLEKIEYTRLPDNFCEIISACAPTASTQENDQTLTCLSINKNTCIASNNQKIVGALFSTEINDSMLLQASEVKNLNSITPIEYSVTEAWMHFKNVDGCIFSLRKIEGEFPDFSKYFEVMGTDVEFPKQTLEGLDLASILADPQDPVVNVKVASSFCYITAKSDSGAVNHRAKINYKGKEIRFKVHPQFFKEMLTHSTTLTVGKTRLKLNINDGDFILITALTV